LNIESGIPWRWCKIHRHRSIAGTVNCRDIVPDPMTTLTTTTTLIPTGLERHARRHVRAYRVHAITRQHDAPTPSPTVP
jgi:hypothetical protein